MDGTSIHACLGGESETSNCLSNCYGVKNGDELWAGSLFCRARGLTGEHQTMNHPLTMEMDYHDTTCAKHRHATWGSIVDSADNAAGQQKQYKTCSRAHTRCKISISPTSAAGERETHTHTHTHTHLLFEGRGLILYHTRYPDRTGVVNDGRARPAPIAWDTIPPIKSMGCQGPGSHRTELLRTLLPKQPCRWPGECESDTPVISLSQLG